MNVTVQIRCHFQNMGIIGWTGLRLKHILNHWNFTLVHRRLPPWSTQLPSERLLRQRSILTRLSPCYIVRAIISQQDFRKLKFSKHMVELGCITIQIQILVFTSGDSIGDSIEEFHRDSPVWTLNFAAFWGLLVALLTSQSVLLVVFWLQNPSRLQHFCTGPSKILSWVLPYLVSIRTSLHL